MSKIESEALRSIQEQKPATKNQISNNKPDVFKNANFMEGYFANSCNGGMLRPIAYKKVMAGEKIYDYSMKIRISMLTPKTPAYQRLKANLKCFFVPDSRVWKNSEKFYSQRGGSTETKISEIPNLGGVSVPFWTDSTASQDIIYTDTEYFRDSWVSSYVPKYQTGSVSDTVYNVLPKYNVLPLRGFVAIYNDFLRNKEYDAALQEFDTDTVTSGESNYYFPTLSNSFILLVYSYNHLRGRRQNSYYTDYRTELLGDDIDAPSDALQNVVSLTEWQKQVAELRSEAENAQLNDWDIISKIRGSKPLTEGKVNLLGQREIGLNYKAIAQDTYNVNETISEDFQVLGQQGAYSYTEAEVTLFQMQEFKEEGFIHVVMQVTADTVFETGFERTLLNVGAFDNYRPDLVNLKNDVLYDIEKSGTRITGAEDLTSVTGFKRKYSEYFKLPNCIAGDMTTGGYYKTSSNDNGSGSIDFNTRYASKRTYQFFEIDDREQADFEPKNIWQDYTDFLINKNQAIMQDEVTLTLGTGIYSYIQGQNQIFFVGVHACVADLPMDESIKGNYTKWGEM